MCTLSERIQAAMAVREMTQADLVRVTGMPSALISKICSGNTPDPYFTSVVKIARGLDVSLEYLAGIKRKR